MAARTADVDGNAGGGRSGDGNERSLAAMASRDATTVTRAPEHFCNTGAGRSGGADTGCLAVATTCSALGGEFPVMAGTRLGSDGSLESTHNPPTIRGAARPCLCGGCGKSGRS